MSKRKHRRRQDTRVEGNSENRKNVNNANNANRQPYNNGPFGINPNQLLSMFGNIDMNQINSILQSMNTQGFDFNNFNLGNLQNLMGAMGSANNQRRYNNREEIKKDEDESDYDGLESDNITSSKVRDDENIQMLMAIRSIVSGKRLEFIDRIIELYNKGEFDE